MAKSGSGRLYRPYFLALARNSGSCCVVLSLSSRWVDIMASLSGSKVEVVKSALRFDPFEDRDEGRVRFKSRAISRIN